MLKVAQQPSGIDRSRGKQCLGLVKNALRSRDNLWTGTGRVNALSLQNVHRL